jgi:hypothetical protein
METGYIKIIREEGKAPSVAATLADNNLWLNKYQIAKLFNCFPQKVEANLRSIFKNRLLYESDVTYTHRYTYNGIEKQCLYYNMEVLLFLSYPPSMSIFVSPAVIKEQSPLSAGKIFTTIFIFLY